MYLQVYLEIYEIVLPYQYVHDYESGFLML
jgi:hypothetical protein